MTEQELLEGLLVQDRKAIQFLVRDHGKKVLKTIFYFVGNMEDAEDIAQDVFLEILRSAGRLKKKASLYTWIYRISVNRSFDHLRKQKRKEMFVRIGTTLHLKADFPGGYDTQPGTSDTPDEDREKRKLLDEAVNSLSENQRIAFILNKYDERSYKEIAEIMNVSLSSIESLIHRAKISLQKKLARHFSEYANKKY
jgi:RNA polymerase sigma factor (sigma-70 family)